MKPQPYLFFLVLTAAVILLSGCRAASAEPSEVWHTYQNQRHGYAFNYPSDCTFGPLPADCKSASPEEQRPACLCFLNPENPDRVVMQTFQSEGDQLVLAEFSVAQLNTPAHNPPSEMALTNWLAENFPDKWQDAKPEKTNLDGVSAVSLSSPASEMAPGFKEIYFFHHDDLFQISMLNPTVTVNSKLYESILASFRFDAFAQPGETPLPDEIRAFIIQPEERSAVRNDFWTVYEDKDYGIRFAVPCFWEVHFPNQYHSSGTAYPIRNYSEVFTMSFGKNHNAVWENGGIKIDMNFDSGGNLGLSPEATLEDYISVDKTGPESELTILSSEAILINGQKGLLVTSKGQLGGEVHSYYLLKVSENLFLSFRVYPSQAIDNPDVHGILHSLALSPDVEVNLPEIIPNGPPDAGETACLRESK